MVSGQEFSEVFKASDRKVDTRLLAKDILKLEEKVQEELADAERGGHHKVRANSNGFSNPCRA